MSDVDRPLVIARYSTRALDTLGQRPALLTDVGHGKFRSPTNPVSPNERLESSLGAWVTARRAELSRQSREQK